MNALKVLNHLKANSGTPLTVGLSEVTVKTFLAHDRSLNQAIKDAMVVWEALSLEEKSELKKPEIEVVKNLQEGILNFYSVDDVCPYVPLAAQGPWIISAYGSVIYDVGGYGMIGFGHNPDSVCQALAEKQVMANVKTANFKQRELVKLLRTHIGFKKGACPYSHFVWMNSGSESVTVAYRIIDANARIMTDPGAKHTGKRIVLAAAKGGFHGRTNSAAQVSDSSMKNYKKYLATFRDKENLLLYEMNNVESVKALYEKAKNENLYVEGFFLEPVMGEGNPGEGATREFYDAVKAFTKANDTVFVVDSIQAGLRANGCLSIVDYPGFETASAPDLETFSKALNAGQFPLSVLAMQSEMASIFKVGLYGNTMTTSPRALEVAKAVLSEVTPALATNIQTRGKEFLDKFAKLKSEIPGAITKIQGVGLLFGVELSKDMFPVVGKGGVEEHLRWYGLNIIHGGPNSLRFTPHFWVSSAEVDMIIDLVRDALSHFAKKNSNQGTSQSAYKPEISSQQ